MPAISLSHLRVQAARLAEQFHEPRAFLTGLRELLEFYQDRTRRKTQAVVRTSLPAFHVPAPVLRQVLLPLIPLAERYPLDALALVDTLWQAGYLEMRLLAAALVGYVPTESAMPLYSRLGEWLEQTREPAIQEAILRDAFQRLRRERPDVMLHLAEEWLKASAPRVQGWGLQALTLLLQDSELEDLPRVFRLLRPALQAAGPATQLALATCLEALCRLSPVETVHFLREVLRDQPPPMMVRTLQRIQGRLPQAVREKLGVDIRVAITKGS